MVERYEKKTHKKDIPGVLEDIENFEKQLTDDGTLLIKFFPYHFRKEQEKRFDKLLSKEETSWRVSKADKDRNKHYEEYATYGR